MAPGYINRAVQRHINSGLKSLDQKFELALQNIRPGQSREEFERTRDNAKARIIQSAYAHMIAMVAKQVVEDTAEFFPKMGNKLATPGFDNMVQDYINRGMNALDEKFAHAMRNILPGQSPKELERARDSAKGRVIQAVYEPTIAMVEKKTVEDAVEFLSKEDALTKPDIDNAMQGFIERGMNALDEKFELAMKNIPDGQSRNTFEKARDNAKGRIIQSIYEHATAMLEQRFVEDAADFFSKTEALTTYEINDMAQSYLDRGLNALDEKFEHAIRNIPLGQSTEEFERARDGAKAHISQSVYEHMISIVEKQAVSNLAEFIPKMGKKFRKPGFDNPGLDYMDSVVQRGMNLMVQGYIKKGVNALDGTFGQAMKNIFPGQSPEELEKIRDNAKDRIIQSVYEQAFSMAEKQVIEDDAEFLSKMEKNLATPELDNVGQDSINDGLNAFDEKNEHAPENIIPGQPSEKLERTSDSGEDRNIQRAYERTISMVDMVEKQVVAYVVKSLPKTDVLTTSKFNDIVRDSINHGLDAFDKKIEHAQQSMLPVQTSEEFAKTRDSVKARLIQSINETCHSEGWDLHQQEQGNLEWESPAGPLLLKRGLSLQQLKLDKADIASGNFGSVSIFENENGAKLIGKTLKGTPEEDEQGNIIDELAEELKAYQTIYDTVGPHPNIVNVYGIAEVTSNGKKMRTLLMDAVPGKDADLGKTGVVAFDALRKSWNEGKISNKEYWGAIQFIGRRLLDVTEHIGKAGVVHNDIKPDNFIVDEKTGEPVLVDFGTWSKKGEVANGGTGGYMSLEAAHQLGQEALLKKLKEASPSRTEDGGEVAYPEGVDERSDVFTVGASLLAGVEGLTESNLPNKGLLLKPKASKDSEGNVVRDKASYSAETAYTRFMNAIMAQKQEGRANSNEAKKFDFLSDSMLLNEDAAKAAITKALSLASEESKNTKKRTIETN